MRFGVREICNVVLRAKAKQTLGNKKFYKNEPVLYFDTLKTSSLEGASTTVYATGGRGNTRLVAWEGERTLTFTMEDALISPESFSILSGAGLIDVNNKAPIFVHTQSQVQVEEENTIVLPEIACWNKYDRNGEFKDYRNAEADIFVMTMIDGEIAAEPCVPVAAVPDLANGTTKLTCYSHAGRIEPDDVVLVDYYVKRTGGAQLIEITADKFGGNYYLEASTLFRRERDGGDIPAEFIIPNCKVQSNFNFAMASTGDPSTFTFTMDAFPDYTKFDKTHKVLAAIQVISDEFEDDVDTRQPCARPRVKITARDRQISVTYDNDSTENDIKVTATGARIVGNTANGTVKYDTTTFNANKELDDANATELDFDFSKVVKTGSEYTYRIIQSNPALSYYPNDKNIKNNIKTKEYDGSALAVDTYGILLSEKFGPINLKVYEIVTNNETKQKTEELIYSIKVTKDIGFQAIPEKD